MQKLVCLDLRTRCPKRAGNNPKNLLPEKTQLQTSVLSIIAKKKQSWKILQNLISVWTQRQEALVHKFFGAFQYVWKKKKHQPYISSNISLLNCDQWGNLASLNNALLNNGLLSPSLEMNPGSRLMNNEISKTQRLISRTLCSDIPASNKSKSVQHLADHLKD